MKSTLDPAVKRFGVVVVTGASAGVGRAVAHRFARDGCRIGLIARDREALEAVRQEVEQLGGRAFVAPADVADADAVFAAAAAIEQELGGIDVWINNAMATVFSPFWQVTPDEYRRVTDVTYLGFVHGTMAALQTMRPRDHGTIVQVGSALAYRAIPLQSAYCGAKHAIRGFTDSLRSELIYIRSRVRLTAVHLPAVNTPQFGWARTHLPQEPRPAGPIHEPEVAADAIHHAAHHAGREYWLGTSTDIAILGNMVAPELADHYLASTAFDGQSGPDPVDPDRQDNLFQPVAGRHAVRGSFSGEATSSALRLSDSTARFLAAAGVLGLTALVGFMAGSAGRNRRR